MPPEKLLYLKAILSKTTFEEHRQHEKRAIDNQRTTLCAIGIKLRSLKFFDIIVEYVHIRQKTIHHTPIEKLTDAFTAILSGAHGFCEINTRVRTDTALQRAFGRNLWVEQSVVQETLDACTSQNISQMKRAFKALLKAHGRAYRHPYKDKLQLLDVDITSLPCGRKAEKASKGYFANRPHRYGRQMARVIAAHYEEIVSDCVLPGNVQLNKVYCREQKIAAFILDNRWAAKEWGPSSTKVLWGDKHVRGMDSNPRPRAV